mmetsp:Transcript_99680/g.278478  ORF Transcript_99680/g.278478 Transcript_99680/m.278478 type:complete len:290 (-) Transcript_99680:814-1683(-)
MRTIMCEANVESVAPHDATEDVLLTLLGGTIQACVRIYLLQVASHLGSLIVSDAVQRAVLGTEHQRDPLPSGHVFGLLDVGLETAPHGHRGLVSPVAGMEDCVRAAERLLGLGVHQVQGELSSAFVQHVAQWPGTEDIRVRILADLLQHVQDRLPVHDHRRDRRGPLARVRLADLQHLRGAVEPLLVQLGQLAPREGPDQARLMALGQEGLRVDVSHERVLRVEHHVVLALHAAGSLELQHLLRVPPVLVVAVDLGRQVQKLHFPRSRERVADRLNSLGVGVARLRGDP